MISISENFDKEKEFVNILLEVRVPALKPSKFTTKSEYNERKEEIKKIKEKAFDVYNEFFQDVKNASGSFSDDSGGGIWYSHNISEKSKLMFVESAYYHFYCGTNLEKAKEKIEDFYLPLYSSLDDILDLLED